MPDHAPPSAGEVRALAHQLLSWADELAARYAAGDALTDEQRQDLVLAVAEAMRQVNLLRTQMFDMPFGNPNWDVMLDLFIRQANGRRVTLDNLALVGEIPAPTVHRCIELLTARGLVERVPDRFEPHIEWLSLSAPGKQAMTELLLRTARFMQPCVVEAPAAAAVPESFGRFATG